MNEWMDAGVFVEMWYAFLDRLDQQGRLDWDEVFVDGSFAPAKKGLRRWGNKAWKGNLVDGGG
jgi:hypothetical protein